MNKNTTVLVTGASGFIAIHTVIQLLQQGYTVRGTLRSMGREAELRKTIGKFVQADERLSFVEADLLSDKNWDEAMQGCDYLLHMASPFPVHMPQDENELIRPAVEGTRRALKAASENGIKRVVLTSSIAAIASGYPQTKKVFNEDDWSLTDSPTIDAYSKSKTLAERAAWDFMKSLPAENKMELAVINPSYVLGPLPDTHLRTSGALIFELMKANAPGVARMQFRGVDVRDVADAHIKAMTSPDAAGQRFLCTSETFWMKDLAVILKKHFYARGYKIKTLQFPDWAVYLFAIFMPPVRATLASLGKSIAVDNSKIKKMLNWSPRSLEEMAVAMAESMIELKML